ncbi:Protein yippee-like [Aphelenchoides besseyi]|nr:Protein yippee-like [Aphelenchoides besseyi]KAI6212050.1 Protein yippee-like [Aphelenchoides besseyi]
MGRIFLEHLGGDTTFHCYKCMNYLTNKYECLSDSFTGASGPAFLFRRVVNVKTSELQQRDMITGQHIVRDVSCTLCNTKLGWEYEFAYESNQTYKEGYVVLEKKLLRVLEESNPSLAQCVFSRRHCGSMSSMDSESGVSSNEEN